MSCLVRIKAYFLPLHSLIASTSGRKGWNFICCGVCQFLARTRFKLVTKGYLCYHQCTHYIKEWHLYEKTNVRIISIVKQLKVKMVPCAWTPSLSLLITVPSVRRLLLMDAPSFIRKPSAPVFAILSDPAKSTRVKVETQTAPPSMDSGSLLLLSTT